MIRYLRHLTPIRGGSLRRILTATRLNAMQDAIHALARGDNLTAMRGLAKLPGATSVRIDLRQRKGFVTAGGGASGCTQLKPSLRNDGGTWKLGISTGFSGDIVPDYEGGNLSDPTPPEAVISGATSLWLKIEWEPDSDDDGDFYWLEGGGEMVSADFEVAASKPGGTAAAIDEETGSITNGVYAIHWAEIVADGGGGYELGAWRCGNHQATWCAPNTLKLFFD